MSTPQQRDNKETHDIQESRMCCCHESRHACVAPKSHACVTVMRVEAHMCECVCYSKDTHTCVSHESRGTHVHVLLS